MHGNKFISCDILPGPLGVLEYTGPKEKGKIQQAGKSGKELEKTRLLLPHKLVYGLVPPSNAIALQIQSCFYFYYPRHIPVPGHTGL